MKHWLWFVCSWFVLTGCCPPGEELKGLYAVAGHVSYSVPGLANASLPVPGALRISTGTTSDLLLTDPEGHCELRARVEAEALVLAPGPACTWTEQGVHFRLTLTHGKVRLADGQGRLDMAGRVMATARGVMYPGSFLQNTTLTRVGE